MTVAKTSLKSIWFKQLNGTTFSLLDTKTHGMGAKTLNKISSKTPGYGREADGVFKNIVTFTAVPGDFDTRDIMLLQNVETMSEIAKLAEQGRGFYMQVLTYPGPPVSNRALWKRLEHGRLVVDSGSEGAGPMRDGSDDFIEDTYTVKFEEYCNLYRTSLSAITTSETEDILSVAGLSKNYDYLAGYPGADKIIVVGCDESGGGVAEILYSFNGGGSFTAIATDPSPFTTTDTGINNIEVQVINDTQFRLICGRITDAGTKAQFAYQDFPWVGTTMTAASWNVITIAATSNADAVEAFGWYQDLGRLYIGAAGDIYVSTDNGETDPGAAVYTGSNALAAFTRDGLDNVWAVGATNTILREQPAKRGTFAARVGPSGGGAFTAITFASDGTLFAGNGTSIYKSVNSAADTNGWTALKSFGASHVVKDILCLNGTSTCLRVTVDDTTPGAGEVWTTEDGGNTWTQITALSNNDGYNDVYHFGSDYNKSLFVGDDDGSTAVIELLS